MVLRKLADWFIKLLGGYTPLEYDATHSLYLDYKRKCFEYRDLIGPLERAKEVVDAIEKGTFYDTFDVLGGVKYE